MILVGVSAAAKVCVDNGCKIACLYERYDGGDEDGKYCKCFDRLDKKNLFSKKDKSFKSPDADSVSHIDEGYRPTENDPFYSSYP